MSFTVLAMFKYSPKLFRAVFFPTHNLICRILIAATSLRALADKIPPRRSSNCSVRDIESRYEALVKISSNDVILRKRRRYATFTAFSESTNLGSAHLTSRVEIGYLTQTIVTELSVMEQWLVDVY